MQEFTGRIRYVFLLLLLIICALLLLARLVYWYLADPQRFPVTTVKIVASYQHITRNQLELILAKYRNDSFYSVPVGQLEMDLRALDWSNNVVIERMWPDTLKIVLEEKEPIALWNGRLITTDGKIFSAGALTVGTNLPRLSGPQQQQIDVLQIYQKLSKLLSTYGLHAAALQLRDNQAWELELTNGVELHLGKRDLEKRVLRFCKAYPAIFADKPKQLTSVDLRYARGMAVQWKGAMNN